MKQWKRPRTIYKNLMKLRRIFNLNISDNKIFAIGNTRLGLFKQCVGDGVNLLFNNNVLSTPNKKRGRPGLVIPEDLLSK